MVHAETTKRSALDATALVGRLQARGVAQLQGEAAIWVLVDGSDLRKPHARAMEGLQRVKRLMAIKLGMCWSVACRPLSLLFQIGICLFARD